MGQQEVLEYLKKLRNCGDDEYKPASKIIKDLQSDGMTNGSLRRVRYNLVKLEAFGYVEAKINSKRGNWRREWRIRQKYI